ncbi:hypothetical protein E6W39_34110 [Kitasatospora acidiphila]|uniref:Uncharacterized protein n=1 Tax=Kitasatospora acidiphila TaxID=2567942 RepID=A0A540WBM5_9ACTN|nr:hypothetical protein [Kitasatospora acidiphila]TQF06327.1 hypothetical protein E6W39_34110 [Kitasatospora acidiphila]
MAEKPGTGFELIQRQAACTFAARARIEAVAPFHGADAREAGLAAAGALADLTECAGTDELDGLLIELTDARHGFSLETVAVTTREVLVGLLEADGNDAAEALSNAGAEHWWLTLCGTRWFALAFAPCYPADSPRFTLGSRSTFLLLQPVASFDRHATPRGSVIAEEVRQMIRHAYASVGCPYDTDLARQDVEALKFVWPLRQGDAPVQWWRSGTGGRREPA